MAVDVVSEIEYNKLLNDFRNVCHKNLESRLAVIQGHTFWQKSIPGIYHHHHYHHISHIIGNDNFPSILSRFRDITALCSEQPFFPTLLLFHLKFGGIFLRLD